MSVRLMKRCALGLLVMLGAAAPAGASLITAAGKASTSNKGTVSTTTTGQKQILTGIDPIGTYSWQLDYMYETSKVQIEEDEGGPLIYGVNGYVVDGWDEIVNLENGMSVIQNIRGHYVGDFQTFLTDGPTAAAVGEFAIPPQTEIDIFEILFRDVAPSLEKRFLVFASDENDFIQGMNEFGQFVENAEGPEDITPALLIIPGDAPDGTYPGQGGTPQVPLPGALLMGMLGGAGVLGRRALGRDGRVRRCRF